MLLVLGQDRPAGQDIWQGGMEAILAGWDHWVRCLDANAN